MSKISWLEKVTLYHDLFSSRPKNKIDFLISTIICYFMAFIISIAICVTARCSGYPLLLALSVGLFIDALRWRFSPELKISAYQRQCSFQRAKDDSQYRSHCRKIFSRNIASIYWCWWSLVFVSLVTGFRWVPNTMGFSESFYPFLRCQNLIDQGNNGLQPAILILKFVSVSWIFMLVAIVAEISGGAFYYFHRPVPGLIVGRQALFEKSSLGIFRFFLALFCLSITYFFFALTRLTITNPLNYANVDRSHLAGHFLASKYYYEIIMNGFTLMCSAGCLRALYAYFLLRSCIVFPEDKYPAVS